ncbi:MAG: hypothetical protein LBE91_22405 [Tannerella sp.]|jgi:hypothetical protein|nr:hypothetical protein [Tannerella sp.]
MKKILCAVFVTASAFLVSCGGSPSSPKKDNSADTRKDNPVETKTDTPVDRMGVKGPLKFNGINFNLAWTDRPRDTYYIQEYLPDGERVENFNQLLTIHILDTDVSLPRAVEQKENELTERKKTDPVCNYKIIKSADGKEFIIDFLLGESKDGEMTIVEFNIYRYREIQINNNPKALLIYAYSKRAYGDNITAFLQKLADDRTIYLNEMASTEIPAITIESK